jgi:pilus assembly protein CpaF
VPEWRVVDGIDYGPILTLVEDPALTEIMINGPGEVWVEREGRLHLTSAQFPGEPALLAFIDQIAAYVGRRISVQEPMLDARLPDGSRVNVILPPLSLSGPVVTIRRFARDAITSDDLVDNGSATPGAIDFLTGCVVSRRNILLSGRTGCGKTTLLNILSGWIPATDRIISIEDSAELQLRQPHWIRLETRPADIAGRNEATTRHLLRNALRMRPDRIIVGEVRGGEALDMLQAMTTGHDGSMSTIHANSPREALQRLETLTLMGGVEIPQRAVRDQIASALNLIVHLERTETGARRIARISEIVGREGEMVTMQDVFTLQERPDRNGTKVERLMPTSIRPHSLDAMDRVRDLLPPGLAQVYPERSRTA